eukprot:835027_1
MNMGRKYKSSNLAFPICNCRFRRFQNILFIILIGIIVVLSCIIYDLSSHNAILLDNVTDDVFEQPIIQQSSSVVSPTSHPIPPTSSPRIPKPTTTTTTSTTTTTTTTTTTSTTTPKPTAKPKRTQRIRTRPSIHHNTWTVNWTLAMSPHNLTSENVSSSVIWHNPHYIGQCATQLYPILTNADGLEYLWVHEIMSIEIGTKVWIFATDPSTVFGRKPQPSIWLGLYKSYLICAFNDGTTVVSEEIKFMRRKNLDFIIIICDIPKALQSYVLSSGANTSVGVSLFDSRNRSLNIKYSHKQWMNVTLPVCSTIVVNRGKHIYHSDGTKFKHIIQSDDPITAKKSHFLSACLIVHPSGDKYNQMNTRIVEWIEYGIIMGFDHFYIYDHMYGERSEKEDKFIWDAIYYYIKHGGTVTYIEWPFQPPLIKGQSWIFQYSFINSCLNRFKYDNDYMAVIDVDEYLIPPKKFITVVDVIKHINGVKNKHVNMFVLKCKLATTCPEKLGCEARKYFNSFLERHGCISDDNPPTNPKKYIVNPMAMWYAFVHGIPRWKDDVDNVAEVFTDIGICLHARDHHKAHTFYHNESVDHVIGYLDYAWKHDIKIHPLFDQNRVFCSDE